MSSIHKDRLFTFKHLLYEVLFCCRDIIHENITEQISAILVLPHFLSIPIHNQYQSSSTYPLPQVQYTGWHLNADVIIIEQAVLVFCFIHNIKFLFYIPISSHQSKEC